MAYIRQTKTLFAKGRLYVFAMWYSYKGCKGYLKVMAETRKTTQTTRSQGDPAIICIPRKGIPP